jgi:hypothetical protein
MPWASVPFDGIARYDGLLVLIEENRITALHKFTTDMLNGV